MTNYTPADLAAMFNLNYVSTTKSIHQIASEVYDQTGLILLEGMDGGSGAVVGCPSVEPDGQVNLYFDVSPNQGQINKINDIVTGS